MPRVSVLLTSYNKPEMLERAIISVLTQTYIDFELIILDDNSNKATWEVINRYLDVDRIILYKSNTQPENRMDQVRYAVNANVGLKLAAGELVTYLCDDDYYLENRLEKMVEKFDSDSSIRGVYGMQRVIRNGQLTEEIRPANDIKTESKCEIDHSSFMHYTSDGRLVGWDTDPRWWGGADAVFLGRIMAAGVAFHPIPEILDVHEYHDNSVQQQLGREGKVK